MLSTPPAFNLSQNQTLQLIDKTHWHCPQLPANKLKVFVPVRSSLFKEPSRFASHSTGNPHCLANLSFAVKRFLSNRIFFDPANKKRYRGILCFLTRIRYSVSSTFFSPDRHRSRLKTRFRFSNRPGELVHRSGEVGLCAFYHSLSTSFLLFFAFCSPKPANPFISLTFFFCPNTAQHVAQAVILTEETFHSVS